MWGFGTVEAQSQSPSSSASPQVKSQINIIQSVYLKTNNLKSILLSRDYSKLQFTKRSLLLFNLASNPLRHRKVFQAISAPNLYPVLLKQPQAPIKYLSSAYLALNLTTTQRADAFCYHYKHLCRYLSESKIKKIFFDELLVWTYCDEIHNHSITVVFSHPTDNEGELSINYVMNSSLIYTISFTFIDSKIFKIGNETSVFVTRIQGVRNNLSAVRSSTKSLKDISPPFALVSALEGFALALKAKMLIGVSAKQQVLSEQHEYPDEYDEFFSALGATQTTASDDPLAYSYSGYFRLTLPIPEKPITNIKRSHRSRTKTKRKFRREISDAVYNVMMDNDSFSVG